MPATNLFNRSGAKTFREIEAVRLLTSASWPLTALVAVFILAEAMIPNLVIIAIGRVTGNIPDAVTSGLSSSAGHHLIVALIIAGVIYTISLLRGPFEDALGTLVSARLQPEFQARLMHAVSAPAGISHLEDPATLAQLSSAQGELIGDQPSDAPMVLAGLIGDHLSGVIACVVLASFRWWLGLSVFVAWMVVRRPLFARIADRVSTFRQAAEPLRRSWYFQNLIWGPNAAKEIRIFGLKDWASERYRAHSFEGLEPSWKELRRFNITAVACAALVFCVYLVSALEIGLAGYHGEIGLGKLSVLLLMLPSTMTIGTVSGADVRLQSLLSTLPDLDGLRARLAPAHDPASEGLPAIGLPRSEIRLERVSFRYPGADSDVLSEIDLTIPAGKSTAIVGVNGAGKTTLVTLLARLREPTGGRILVDGTPVTAFNPRQWQRQFAVVYQDFNRYPLTAEENIGLNLLGEMPDREALAVASSRSGSAAVIDGLANGWQTPLSPQYGGGVDLSGGQWQRIALARALYAVERGATVLILDEPTAQLDVRAEAAFYDRFLEITAGVTSIVISHRFSTVRRADRIVVIDSSRITEQGDHESLLAAGGTYAEMFNLQADSFKAQVRR